jgi:hypothetical protein
VKSVNFAPHGREGSAPRSHGQRHKDDRQGASAPNRSISLRADKNQELLLFAPTRHVPAITPSKRGGFQGVGRLQSVTATVPLTV